MVIEIISFYLIDKIENNGLTYDFYEAFMAWNLKISGLKQLSYNSIVYSSLNETEKEISIQEWEIRWKEWILYIINDYMLYLFNKKF